MIKVKDGYAKLIGTSFIGNLNFVLLSNGSNKQYSTTNTASTLVERDANQAIFVNTTNSAISVNTPKVNNSGALVLNSGTEILLKYNNDDTKSIVLNSAQFRPFLKSNNLIDLGSTDGRWKGVYAGIGNFTGQVTALKFVKSGGSSTLYLMADGSVSDLTDLDEKYVNVDGDTMKGRLNTCHSMGTWILGKELAAIKYNSLNPGGKDSWESFLGIKTNSGNVVSFGSIGDRVSFVFYKANRTDNNIDGQFTLDTTTGNWKTTHDFYARGFHSNVPVGTAPYQCTSTTLNTNLNADLFDGYHETSFFRNRGSLTIASPIPTKTELSNNNNLSGSWNVSYPEAYGHLIQFNTGTGSTRYVQFYSYYSGSLYWRNSTDSTLNTKPWKTIVDSTNYTTIITSVKNPYALTLLVNGVELVTYDGSTAKTFNISLPRIAYDYTNGVLVKINANATTDSMIVVRIIGNSYSNNSPFDTTVQFYNYNSSNGILQPSAVNNGSSFGNIKAFNYDGKICIWFKLTQNYLTFFIKAYSYNNNNLSCAVSNSAMPTSGVTRLVEIVPKNPATSLTARKINGTLFDGTADIITTFWGTARNISIADHDKHNTGTAVSVNGSTNYTLELPAIIKATLDGDATYLTANDTRSNNYAPNLFTKGIRFDFKSNSIDGLNDGGDYHRVLRIKGWQDSSGGKVNELGVTDNGNLWIRTSTNDTTWGTWRRFAYINEAVTALGTNGNNLTWTKNGTVNNITIPYATSSDRLNSSSKVHNTGLTYYSSAGFVVDGTGTGGLWGMPSNSLDASYKLGQCLRMYFNSGYYTDILSGPNAMGNTCGLYLRQIVNNNIASGSFTGGWRLILDSYNYASILDSRYYTESESDNRFVNVAGDTMTGPLTITAEGKNVVLGSGNELYTHYTTNTSRGHFFNKNVYVNGNIYAGTNEYNQLVWHQGNDGSGSGLDADLLDGIHASGLFTALTNNEKLLSVTIGGTNKKLTVGYATVSNLLEGAYPTSDLNTPSTWSDEGRRLVYDNYSGSSSNKPVNVNNANALITLFKSKCATSSLYASQLAFPDNESIYFRKASAGTWTAWKKLAFVSDIGNGIITIKLNGVSKGSFTLNQNGNTTFELDGSSSLGTSTIGSSTRPVYLNAGTITAVNYSFGNAAGNAAINNRILNTNLNADLLDGVEYLNILERLYSGTSNLKNSTWYRIAETKDIDARGASFILFLHRSYTNTNNESYTFSINIAYNGGISITQLSGHANDKLISQIRVDHVNSNKAYIDFYILTTTTTDNTYYWTTVGSAKSYSTASVASKVGTIYSFTTVNGFKSDSSEGSTTSCTLWGQTFTGTNNVSGTLSSVDSIYMNGSITGVQGIRLTNSGGDWISQKGTFSCICLTNFNNSKYIAMLRMQNANNNVFTLGGYANTFGFYGYKSTTTKNKTDCYGYYSFDDNKWHFSDLAIEEVNRVGENVYSTATPIVRLSTSCNPVVARGAAFNGVICDYGFGFMGDSTGASSIRMQEVFPETGTWTVSFEVCGSLNAAASFDLKVGTILPTDEISKITTTNDNTWKKVVKTFKVTSTANRNLDFLNINYKYFYFRHFKVEKGTVATAFSVAKEDMFRYRGDWTDVDYTYYWESRSIILRDKPSNPLIQFKVSSSNWYILAFTGTLAIGCTSTKSLTIDLTGNVSTPGKISSPAGFWKESDRRLKSDIKPLTHTLDLICSIPTASFIMNNTRQIGTIALDLEDLGLNELVSEDNSEEYVKIKKVEYEMLSIIAIEGIKLLKDEIDKLKKLYHE